MSDLVVKSVKSVCPYCGVGCGMLLETDGQKIHKVSGDKQHPSNFGRLCTKGQTSAQALVNSGRMESAFVRNERKQDPVKTAMADAISATARRLRQLLDNYGPDAISFYVSGQMSMESQYLANKLAKGFIRTNNIESNSRLCMASAGMGYKLSLGSDAPPGSYEDFDHTDCFLVIGSNMADCHPILYLRMMDRIKAGAKLIVVDPRRTTTADKADLFLPIKPGTDLAFLNGILYLLHQAGKTDADFIATYTQGWEQLQDFLHEYTPENVSKITSLSVEQLHQAAKLIGDAKEFITCWTMGLNQSTHGTWSTNAICNLHLATGKICRKGSGPFSLTGQPNAMGGREMGYMGVGLPGQRSIMVEKDRAFIESLWQIPQGSITTKVGKGTVDLFERMAAGEVKACWIICTNPVASVPNRKIVIEALQKAELVIAQDAFLDTETNRYADILLPGALWAEAEGVMINSERNITLMQQAVNPPGEAMADWEIIARVAREMGFSEGFNFSSAAEVFEEIKQTYNPKTGYDLRGVSHQALRESPMQWPCADQDSPRNPVRYINDGVHQPLQDSSLAFQFATDSGKAQFFARPHVDPAEMPNEEFSFLLNTGRVQHQWHTLTKTGKIPTLNKLNPGTFVEINPEDAEKLGIKNKDKVEIKSRRGYAILPAVVTDRVLPGCCFAPIHWNDVYGDNLCINAVTSDAIDPISQQPELKVAAVSLKRVDVIAEDDETDSRANYSSAGNHASHSSHATSNSRFAPVAEETVMSLVTSLASNLNIKPKVAPEFSSEEQEYLSGFIAGIQASAKHLHAVPALPQEAPVRTEYKNWINGLLAGLFSRVLPEAVVTDLSDKPKLTILWASQTGNAENLAQTFAESFNASGWMVSLHSMNDFSVEQLAKEQKVLFVTSTFGDGDAPDNGGDFWQILNSESAPQLRDLRFALLALGDSNYDQFCGHGKKLFARLQALGAQALVDRVDCDTDFDVPAAKWLADVKSSLSAQGSQAVNAEQVSVQSSDKAYSKANPYPSRLIINNKLSGEGSGKDVRQFGFDLGDSGIEYQAGDALGVWPKNCPEYVYELEQLLNFNADAQVVVDTHEKPLHMALIENYEICKPSNEALHLIASKTKNRSLQELLSADDKAPLQQWLYGRQLVDIIQEFSVKLSAEELLSVLKRLQPRLYSIASSSKAFEKEVHLTVSAVRYSRFTDSKKFRKGVASTFLADRAGNQPVPVFVQASKHFHVPDNGDTPLIMVGPGTGIAPFRGFLQERQARGDQGKNWLFFGEQHAASDFYYQDEILQYQKDGLLTELSLAFSRDQTQKIYVQDRMRERGKELWQWLEEGACFCVCGDASRMAKDVDLALRDIVQKYGGYDDAETANYMRKLNMDKRYLRDVY